MFHFIGTARALIVGLMHPKMTRKCVKKEMVPSGSSIECCCMRMSSSSMESIRVDSKAGNEDLRIKRRPRSYPDDPELASQRAVKMRCRLQKIVDMLCTSALTKCVHQRD